MIKSRPTPSYRRAKQGPTHSTWRCRARALMSGRRIVLGRRDSCRKRDCHIEFYAALLGVIEGRSCSVTALSATVERAGHPALAPIRSKDLISFPLLAE